MSLLLNTIRMLYNGRMRLMTMNSHREIEEPDATCLAGMDAGVQSPRHLMESTVVIYLAFEWCQIARDRIVEHYWDIPMAAGRQGGDL